MYECRNITLEEFKKVVSKFGDNSAYDKILARDTPKNFRNPSKEDIKEILDFLNSWQCRIPKVDGEASIKRAIGNMAKSVSDLMDCELGSLDEDRLKIIKKIFASISSEEAGKRTIGPTAASKIMHILLPKICVMWDDGISSHYGFAHNAEGYIRFLSEMKELRTVVLDDYTRRYGADEQNAEKRICDKLKKKYFTKLIDEYNYGIAEGRIEKWTRP